MAVTFLAPAHTLANYTTAFYEPIVSDWSNYETWVEKGEKTAYQRANIIYRQRLKDYEEPSIDRAGQNFAGKICKRTSTGNREYKMKLQERVTLFQQRLQQVITLSGLNRSSFATSISVDRSTLSQLLSPDNVRLPRADTVASIAEIHQISIDWLLGLTQQGSLGASILPEILEVDDYSSTIFDKYLEWYQEAIGYKIRYVPTTLPDLLKTEAVAEYEFNRYGSGKVDQSVRDNQLLLLQQRHPGSELETCLSLQSLRSFALGQGIWQGLGRLGHA